MSDQFLPSPDRESVVLRQLPAESLRQFITAVLEAVGARVRDASAVADHLVQAHLMGHDSHGISMLSAYVKHIRPAW